MCADVCSPRPYSIAFALDNQRRIQPSWGFATDGEVALMAGERRSPGPEQGDIFSSRFGFGTCKQCSECLCMALQVSQLSPNPFMFDRLSTTDYCTLYEGVVSREFAL